MAGLYSKFVDDLIFNEGRTASTAFNTAEFELFLFAWMMLDVTCVSFSGRSYRSDHVFLNG